MSARPAPGDSKEDVYEEEDKSESDEEEEDKSEGSDEARPVKKARAAAADDGSSGDVDDVEEERARTPPTRRQGVVFPNEPRAAPVEGGRRRLPPDDALHTCPQCRATHVSKAARDKHYRAEHKEAYNNLPLIRGQAKKVFTCGGDTVSPACGPNGCGEEFPTLPRLERHIGVPKYVCGCCKKFVATNSNNLISHEKACYKKIQQERPTARNVTAVQARKRAAAAPVTASAVPAPVAASASVPKGGHRIWPDASPDPANPDMLICVFCADEGDVWTKHKSKYRKETYREHMRKRHSNSVTVAAPAKGSNLRVYVCTEETNSKCACDAQFHHLQAWERHVGAKTYECRLGCGYRCSDTGEQGRHENTHCPTLRGQYACGIGGCVWVSPTPGALQEHQRGVAHVPRERLYVCGFVAADGTACEQACFYPSVLEYHRTTVHTAERTYICHDTDGNGDECLAAFKTKHDLNVHGGVHMHEYIYPCNICAKLSKTPRLLRAHQMGHGERRFQCELCPTRFVTKIGREQHENTHFDERGYVCAICGDESKQKCVADAHMTYVHTHSRAHVCPFCGESCTSPSRLFTHMRVHEPGYTPSGSAMELELARTLTDLEYVFRREVTADSRRLRFDFMVEVEDKTVFIELDGIHHYMPIFHSPAGYVAYLERLRYDVDKSRLCRAARSPLLRFESAPSAEQLEERLFAAVSSPLDYSDYVSGEVWSGTAALDLFLAAITDFPGGLPAAALTLLDTFQFNLSVELLDQLDLDFLLPGIFLHFLREVVGSDINALPGIVLNAASFIAGHMQEFYEAEGGGDTVSVVIRHTAHCWVCDEDVPGGPAAAGADMLLEHVNTAHGLGLLVRCNWCPSVFSCQRSRARIGSAHGPACHGTVLSAADAKRPDVVRLSQCGLCAVPFTSWHALLKHYNVAHAAQFSAEATLQCTTCAARFVTSVEASAHVCV